MESAFWHDMFKSYALEEYYLSISVNGILVVYAISAAFGSLFSSVSK